jgi:hypothetical protein
MQWARGFYTEEIMRVTRSNRTTASVEKIYDNVKLFDSTTYFNSDTEYENLYFVSSIDNKLYGVGGNQWGQLGHNHAHEEP